MKPYEIILRIYPHGSRYRRGRHHRSRWSYGFNQWVDKEKHPIP